MAKKQKGGINPLAAAAAVGAVVGAGVVGAIALSDEENQKKVKQALEDAKNKAAGMVHDTQEKIVKTAETIKDSVASQAEETQKDIKNLWHN